jgi:hypothetical protein
MEEKDIVDQLHRKRFTHGRSKGVDHPGGHQSSIGGHLRAGEQASAVLPTKYLSDIVPAMRVTK